MSVVEQKENRTQTTIERFFTLLSSQGIDAVLDLVTEDAVFEAQGHEGVREFVAVLQDLFDTEKFEIRQAVEQADIAFAYGYMQHRVIKTDKVFCSEFAIYCQIENNRISAYKMFEDTAALAIAYNEETSRLSGRRASNLS